MYSMKTPPSPEKKMFTSECVKVKFQFSKFTVGLERGTSPPGKQVSQMVSHASRDNAP